MLRPSWSLALAVLAVLGCEAQERKPKDAGSPDAGPQAPGCTAYAPTRAGGSVFSEWTSLNDHDTQTVTTPGDVGGGYVEIAISQVPVEVAASLEVQSMDGSVLQTDDAGPGIDLRAAFSAAPDTSYRAVVQIEDGPGGTDAYPLGYSFDWTFTSLVDCFEPNQTQDEAKELWANREILAYMQAGYTDRGLPANDAFTDWYRFELDEPSFVSIDVRGLVIDAGTSLTLHGAEGVLETLTAGTREQFIGLDAGSLEAGEYSLELRVLSPPTLGVRRDAVIPSYWQKRYALLVRVE